MARVTLDWSEIRIRAAAFTARWKPLKANTQEIAEAQTFENEFFEVFGLDRHLVASFEKHVMQDPEGYDMFGNPIGGNDSRIDCLWPGKLLIEMKKRGRDLAKAWKQALKYVQALTDPRDIPQGVLICDFNRFEYHDLNHEDETGNAKVYAFTLDELRDNVEIFAFMTGRTETAFKKTAPVDVQAAERMSLLHNALANAGYTGHPLEVYLVRLLFCLFADDSGIFPRRKQFAQYISDFTNTDGSDLASAFETIFEVLNTPDGRNGQPQKRLSTLSDALKAFPYIDGHLFEERLPIAGFNSAMREQLLECCALDWSKISPAVFGSMFQGVMKDELRRNIGAHYTSETNIMKIVSALFLDDLKAEFEKLKARTDGGREGALIAFHHKLAHLNFFDPACGCGNFLVIAYRELRELEIELIAELEKDKSRALDITSLVWVNVDQFYGIELEEFPAEIAQTALWLVDHLENNKVSERFGNYYVRIPLTKAANIHCANALETDWTAILDPSLCSYILGNPPFLGKKEQTKEQKAELLNIFQAKSSSLDYVCCWYKKAVEYMQNTEIQAAFVSTNSITQGQQVPILWPMLFNRGLRINFAHQTFKWANEAKKGHTAAVHCVIIGFALFDRPDKVESKVTQINPYLAPAPTVFIQPRSEPLSTGTPIIAYGNIPIDKNHLILSPEEAEPLLKDSNTAPMVRPYYGGDEFLNNRKRFCLWLDGISPAKIDKSAFVKDRIEQTRKFRLSSDRKETRELALTSSLFGYRMKLPEQDYLLIPKVSSENRPYIPIGFLDKGAITNGSALVVANARLYEFGVLSSAIHNAWMRTVGGRMKSDYQYSASLVYNTFAWPIPTDKQRETIEKAAQEVLDARARYTDSSLAVLYNPPTMPPDLATAHAKLDKAVDRAYNRDFANDSERLAWLFELYQQKAGELFQQTQKQGKGRKRQTTAAPKAALQAKLSKKETK
jgi:hypothetical protein